MFVGSVHTGCSTLTLKLFGFLKEELGLGCRFGVKCIETKVFQLGVRAVLNLELGALPPKRKLYLQAVHQSTSCTPFFHTTLLALPCQRLNTAHCFWLETIQASGFVSKAPPAAPRPTCSRSPSPAFTAGRPFVCERPRALIRTQSGCWTGDVFSLSHTHTHSTVDLQLAGSGCSPEPHTNIPHSPVQRFSFLSRSHRLHHRFLHCLFTLRPLQTKSHLTSHSLSD